MRKPSICFLPQDETVTINEHETVLEAALRNKIDLAHSCGGMGSCTTCRIWIENLSEVALPARNELEDEIASTRDFVPEERLACQLPALDGMRVRIPLKRQRT